MTIEKLTSSATGRTTKAPQTKDSHAVLESKGQVPRQALLSLKARTVSKKAWAKSFEPASARVSVRGLPSQSASSAPSMQSKSTPEDWELELNASGEEALAYFRQQPAKTPASTTLPETAADKEEPALTGTTVLHEQVAPTGTTVIKDEIGADPDFSKMKLAEESGQEYLKKRERNELPPAADDWHIQKQAANPDDVFALITEKRADGKLGKPVTPFAAYDKEHPSALPPESPVSKGVARLASEGWHAASPKKLGQELKRRSRARILPVSVPKGPPPSYAEAIGIPASPRRHSSREVQDLQRRLAPIAGHKGLSNVQLDQKNRVALLELARNMAGQLSGADQSSYWGKTRDILYAIIRELNKPEPELSRNAFNWLMARATDLASSKSSAKGVSGGQMAEAQKRNARRRKPEQDAAAINQREHKLFSDRLENRLNVRTALEKRIAGAPAKSEKD